MNKPIHYGISDDHEGNGKVYDSAQVGQIIVLANVGGLEDDNPFVNYPQPSFFVVKVKYDGGGYLLQDEQGKEVILPDNMAGYFFFARYYAEYVAAEHDRQLDQLNDQLHDLNVQYRTVRDILVERR